MTDRAQTDPSEEHEPIAREGDHVPPAHREAAYHCPGCGVLASQRWFDISYIDSSPGRVYAPVDLARCMNCRCLQVWVEYGASGNGEWKLVSPMVGGGPRPHVDMPGDVREDLDEARSIVNLSPRGACALLRLATQKLINDHLQTQGGDLNDRIGQLVEDGLPPLVQQSLDALRVIGNEAVHPGELDLRDDAETATGLFMLLNVIVEDRIARPKQVAEMYAKLPAGKLRGIAHRDRSQET